MLIARFLLIACLGNPVFDASEQDDVIKAETSIRVVVQDARPSVMALAMNPPKPNTRQPRDLPTLELVLAVEANRRSNHVFYAIDPTTQTLIHAIDFPERIVGAAIAPSRKWYLVSGESNLYQVDAATGHYRILLENSAGQVAISNDEATIAILGRFDMANHTRTSFRTDAIKLGVYRIAEKKWLAQHPTPIMIGEQVYFDKSTVVGVGVGGRVYNRAASSFPCHTTIDLKSLQLHTVSGRETRAGRPVDDDYEPPALAALNRAKLALCRQLIPTAVNNLEPANRSGLTGTFLPLPTSDNSATLLISRYGDDRWRQAVFKISRSGQINVVPRQGFAKNSVQLGNRIFAREYQDKENETFTDLLTGKESLHPRIDDSSSSPIKKRILTRAGCLDFHEGNLEMLELGGKIRWVRAEFDSYKRLGLFSVSPTGQRLAFTENELDIQILDSRNGNTLAEIARPKNNGSSEYRYTRSLCFNHDETQLAVLFDKEICLYEISSRKILHRITCKKKDYIQKIFHVAGNWFLSGYGCSRFWVPGEQPGEPILFPDVTHVQSFQTGSQTKLILQNAYTGAALLDIDSLELEAKFAIGYEGPHAYDPAPLPNLTAAFDDQVLIVPTGRVAQFKLFRSQDLSIIATVHPIQVNEELGWIVYSDDGWWDASPGAEKFVRLLRGTQSLREYEVTARRKKGLLESLLRQTIR